MNRIISLLVAVLLLGLPQLAAAYSIAPGDALRIEVLEDESLARQVLVLPDGSISFPGAGTVRVAGMTPAAAGTMLTERLKAQFANTPSVYVSVVALAQPGEVLPEPNLIYVMGEIGKPGAIETAKGITLLQAIAQAGGYTRFAATKRIELHRMDPASQTEQIYIFDAKKGSGISGGTLLTEGDVIVVPERRLFE
ncbi:MAG: polysaccharide export protein [Sphingomonadales bacterium]|nr:polysaccharide export protein [Sphingomonadales bacterium]